MGVLFKSFSFLILIIQPAIAQVRTPFLPGAATPMPGATASMTREQCSMVDLTSRMGPVHTQSGGSCYAFTATELLNFGRDTPYSALYLALTRTQPEVARNPGGSPLTRIHGLRGGIVAQALREGLDHGMCPETALPSQDYLDRNRLENILWYYQEAVNEGCRQLPLSTLAAHASELSGELRRKISAWNALRNAIHAGYPSFDISRLEGIFRNESLDGFFTAFAREACGGRLQMIRGHANITNRYSLRGSSPNQYVDAAERQRILIHINHTLNNGRPIGIDFMAGGLLQSPAVSSHAHHSSTIAGRIWKDEVRNSQGQVTSPAGCYFIVKNSWGTAWRVPTGVKAQNVSGRPGYFTMSEQSLLEHVYGSTSID